MIALDTNVIVRYLVEDDPAQAVIARRIIENTLTPAAPGFISLIVLVELGWVLERSYACPTAQVREIMAGLIDSPTIVVEQAAAVTAALAHDHPDLADSLLHEVGRSQGCDRTLTFDRRFAKLPGVDLAS